MAKTHYAEVLYGTECNPSDDWGYTACGLEYTESPLSNKWDNVDCKRCISARKSVENEQKHRYDNHYPTLEQLATMFN